MPKHNPDASELITESLKEAEPFAKKICEKLRSIILKTDSEIIEDWKWGPNYYKNGMVCGYWFFKKHVTFTFFQGSLLKDKKKVLLQNPGNVHNRHLKFTDIKQVDEKLIIEYLTESIINNEKGHIIKEAKDKTVIIPDDFKKLINKNKVLTYFEGLAYSHRKEYVMWINDAKKEETRLRRMDQAVEKLKNKEGMHDKYKK